MGADLLYLHAAYRLNRLRFAWLQRRLQGKIEFGPGCDVWATCLWANGLGRARFGPGCVVERGPAPLTIELEAGSFLDLAEKVWFRGKYRPNVLTLFENSRVSIGAGSLINGAVISARESVSLGRQAEVSWNCTILDSNLHPLQNDEPVKTAPVLIGDHVLIASGTVVLPGSTIGSHTVIGANSVVRGEVPGHVIAAGNPLKVIREIGDRDRCL